MTIKQKFSSIDQSKLTADQKAFLDKIKDVTKNFTDSEMNKKVEAPLDGFIAKAKEKMPEAIKSAPAKRTTKSKAKPSQTRKPKRTAMSLAKEIRKEGESWNDARARASKMMKDDSKDLSKTVETELEKLTKMVRSQKSKAKLVGISKTDIGRDAVRKAKPRGARKVTRSGETSNQYGTYKNHLGRKYTENRDRHSDRLAPNYPKNAPYLADGGYLTDPNFGNFQNNPMFNKGGAITNERRYVNKDEDYEVRYSRPILRRKGYQGKRDFMAGGRVESLTKELYRLQRELNSSRLQTYRLGDNSQEAMDRKNEREVKLARFNEVLKELRESDAKFELGGVMATDLAGHTGGSLGTGDPSMLDGFSNTAYTGLVGETGAMSSGEMFMNGGGLPQGASQSYMITESLGNPAQHFAKGGGVLSRYVIMFEDTKGNKESMRTEAYNKAEAMKVGKYFEGKSQFQGFKAVSVSEVNESFATGGGVKSENPIPSYILEFHKKFADGDENTKIRSWYMKTYPQDNRGKYINLYNTFKDLWSAIQNNEDVYGVIVEGDSLIRERLFDKLSQIKGVPYKVIYNKWLESDLKYGHYAKGGGVRIHNGREYSIGRNWTNDFRHVNKAEEHEVTYNRKGKFLGIFDDGGNVDEEFIHESRLLNHGFTKTLDSDGIRVYERKGYKITINQKDKTYIADIYGRPETHKIYDKKYSLGRFIDLEFGTKFADGGMNNLTIQNVSFAKGGAIKNQYAGRTPEDIWENLTDDQKEHFLYDHQLSLDMDYEKYSYEDLPLKVKRKFREHIMDGEYNKGGALTNERKHVNHDEDYEVRYSKPRPKRKGYKGARKFMAGGMNDETPKIYVADLEAYNNGRLSGVWLDLADYNNADELMDAIQDFLKTSGGEEYAIHDVEYVPRSLYSEYMSKNDFEALYEVMETAKRYDLPLEVVEEIVSQYSASAVDEFQGKYDNAEDFAEQLVDELGGLENFSSPEYYTYMTDTDRRLLAGEMADSYVEGIADEDGGNRIIEEAGLNIDEYENASDDSKEEMLDLASSMVNDEYYDTWYEGLNDPYYFLVEEQGIYSPEDIFNASFISVDYEKLARDLEQDYTFIEHDGDLYVFNIR